MSKIKFYVFFNILNIIILMLILAGMYTVFIFATLLEDGPMLYFYCLVTIYFIYIIYKLLLPKIFIKLADKYKDSLIHKFVEYLQNNPQMEKIILPIAFCFDLPFILYWVNFNNLGELALVIILYIIFYAGGVLLFYIMLYRELKKKTGKINPIF